jgi:hypothetical protein
MELGLTTPPAGPRRLAEQFPDLLASTGFLPICTSPVDLDGDSTKTLPRWIALAAEAWPDRV